MQFPFPFKQTFDEQTFDDRLMLLIGMLTLPKDYTIDSRLARLLFNYCQRSQFDLIPYLLYIENSLEK